jgi:hypothetical protein
MSMHNEAGEKSFVGPIARSRRLQQRREWLGSKLSGYSYRTAFREILLETTRACVKCKFLDQRHLYNRDNGKSR